MNHLDPIFDPAEASETTRFSARQSSWPQPTNSEIPPGTVVGDYEVIGPLGSGGMGRVYRVRHVLSKRIEAMKLVLPDVERNSFIERFQREIEVQGRLNHPNICALHTAVRMGSGLALIMELAEGGPLTEELKSGPVEPDRAIEFACQVLEALKHAHDHGVIHRDIKPGNIIVTAGNQAKLVDFGIARLDGSAELTMQGIAIGSPSYMAPELIKGGRPDPRSDVYATGVTLYEMVTGRRPIGGDTQFEILQAHITAEPPAPHTVNPRVPKHLSKAILTALAKDPADRFQTAAEFLAALRLAPQPSAALPTRWRGMAALGLLGIGAVALGAWLAPRPPKTPEAHVLPPLTASLQPPAQSAPAAKDVTLAVSRPTKAPEQKRTMVTAVSLPAVPAKEPLRIEAAGMDSWGDVSWTNDSGWYVRKGGLPALYPRPPLGSFIFTINRRKGNARWVMRWRNNRDYVLFEVDKNAFHRKQVRDGNTQELAAVRRKNMEKVLTLRIDVSKSAITHSLWINGSWTVLDDWHDSGGDFTGGQFGFWPIGGDEIGLSNFKFTPAVGAGGGEPKQ